MSGIFIAKGMQGIVPDGGFSLPTFDDLTGAPVYVPDTQSKHGGRIEWGRRAMTEPVPFLTTPRPFGAV